MTNRHHTRRNRVPSPLKAAPPCPKPATPSRAAGPPRRSRLLTTVAPVALVVVVVVIMVTVKVLSDPPGARPAPHGTGSVALPARVLADIVAAASAAPAPSAPPATVTPPARVLGSPAPLRAGDGKPEVLYVGAEYCPFCAAERWPLVEALARFGTFTGLRATHSSSQDVFPGTPTLSFYGSMYSSPYLDFSAVELSTNQVVGTTYAPLQTPTATEQALLQRYDNAPYVSPAGSIPFVDLGNRFIVCGASFSPAVLRGQTLRGIAAALSSPGSPVAKAIGTTANEITAGLCRLTGQQPASVCSNGAIKAASGALGT